MEKHETIIIGAGPGGLTAAKELAKKNVLTRKLMQYEGAFLKGAVLKTGGFFSLSFSPSHHCVVVGGYSKIL